MRCKFCLKFFFCLCFGVCGVELIPSKLRFYFRVCDFFVDVFKIVANYSNWTVCLFFVLLKINLLFQFILLPSRCFWKLLRMLLFLRFIAVFLSSCCVFVFFLSFLLQLWWGDYCYKGKKKKIDTNKKEIFILLIVRFLFATKNDCTQQTFGVQ